MHWANLEKQDTTRLELALEMIKKSVGFDAQLVKDEPGNVLWRGYLASGYSSAADISKSLKRPADELTYLQKLVETRRLLAYQLGPPEPARNWPKLQKCSRSVARACSDEAYRLATRIWQRIVEDSDPKGAKLAIDQI